VGNVDFKLNECTVDEAVQLMLVQSPIKGKTALAKTIGITPSTFYSSIDRETIRLVDFIKVAEALGFDIVATKKTTEA
jgi:hypothetical protein